MTINRHRAGSKVAGAAVGGQFATSAKTEADGSALAAEQHLPRPYTAAQVRDPEFTERVIIERFQLKDDDPSINQTVSPDGGSVVAFTQQFGDYSYPTSVQIDRQGDIISCKERGSEGWVDVPGRAEELRSRLRSERLAAMGIGPRGGTHDGGYQFTGDRADEIVGMTDAAEVSKLVRKDFKRAVEFGVLPEDWKVSVRTDKYSMGQSVNIYAAVPHGQLHSGAKYGQGPLYQSEARSVRDALEAIGNQWNEIESDSMRGYHDSNYHLLVNLQEQPEETTP